MDLIRFKHKDISFAIIITAIVEILTDGRFYTKAKGRDNSPEYYTSTEIKNDPNRYEQRLIKPKMDYEMYVLTDDPKECDLLGISYYMGTSYDLVEKGLGDKHFIVKEKLQVKTRIPTSNIEEWKKQGKKDKYHNFHDNDILKYRGIAHHKKKKKDIGYEGDCNTEIKLHDDCVFKMYKFVGMKNI
ncbi:MAG: hypothetical protein AABY15_06885 [Nanoarchaeota archaeon]